MSFTKVLNFFLSLPSDMQRFCRGEFYSTDEQCFDCIGILFNFNELDSLKKSQLDLRIDALPQLGVVLSQEYDLTLEEAKELHFINDGNHKIYEIGDEEDGSLLDPKKEKPEARFNRVVDWLYSQI